MAKQTFTTGQVLTAAQMTSLQQTAMLGGAASAKVASYVLVAADAGDAITMSNAGATTITVNTGLFAAGDTVTIINIGTGACTITAGTATVTTSGSLVLAQNQGGVLRFTSPSEAIFLQFATPASSGDIEGVSVTSPITGGGTSGTVTIGIDSTAVVPAQTGNAGKYLTTDGTNSSWAAVASGATTWTQRMGGEVSATWYGVAYNGSDLYVVYGSAGKLYTSPDGITWTSRTSGFGTTLIRKVIYANSIWVAVGSNGVMTTSSDGITWTARTANMSTNNILDVLYADSLFVAVGAGGGATNTGGITYSSDGITWTRKSQSLTVGTTYYGVIYNGTNWIIAAAASTNNYLYASTPSGTWTVAQWGGGAISEDILGIWYDGTRTIAASVSYWSYSTSTTIASSSFYDNVSPSGLSNQMQNAYYYNGEMYQKQFGYAMDFSTTPGTNFTGASSTKSMAYIEPTAWVSGAASGLNYNNTAGLFVGAVGTIMLGNYGQIYTSF